MQQHAEKLTERVMGEPTEEARIQKAYRLIFGRTASPAEIQAGREFLATEPMKQYEERKAAAEKAKALAATGGEKPGTPPPEPVGTGPAEEAPADAPEAEPGMMAGVTASKVPAAESPARLPVTVFGRYLKVLLSSNEFLFVS
jgi:hypothetical protein